MSETEAKKISIESIKILFPETAFVDRTPRGVVVEVSIKDARQLKDDLRGIFDFDD